MHPVFRPSARMATDHRKAPVHHLIFANDRKPDAGIGGVSRLAVTDARLLEFCHGRPRRDTENSIFLRLLFNSVAVRGLPWLIRRKLHFATEGHRETRNERHFMKLLFRFPWPSAAFRG